MKTVSSSSHQSMRLICLLVVMIPLISIKLSAKETFDSLITRQTTYRDYEIRPKAEVAHSSIEFTIPSFSTPIDSGLNKPLPFTLEFIVPSLIEKEYMTTKKSPFTAKKSINFSKEIAKDEKEDLTSTPFIAEKGLDPLVAGPNLEQKTSVKHDFLSKELPLNIEGRPLNSSSPYSFKPTEGESPLINHNLPHKKSDTNLQDPLKELKTAVPNPKLIAVEKNEDLLLFPLGENIQRFHFNTDSYFFYFEDSFPFTPPYPLKNQKIFFESLSRKYSPPEKREFSCRYFFAESYFKSYQWTNPSSLIEEKVTSTIIPLFEGIDDHFSINDSSIDLDIVGITSTSLSFERLPLSIAFPYQPLKIKKATMITPSLDQTTFEGSSYLYLVSSEIVEPQSHYYPTREKATSLPFKYSLSEGPIVALELDQNVITFTLSPEFDLYCSEGSVNLPKKAQEFQESAIAITHSYLYKDGFQSTEKRKHSPKFKMEDVPILSKNGDPLQLSPSLDPRLDLETAPQKELQSFAFSEEADGFDPKMTHPSFPKHHKKDNSSALQIKESFKGNQKEYIEDYVAYHDYTPSTQKEKETLSKEFPNFSPPDAESHSFSFKTEEDIAFKIADSEANHEKYAHMESGQFSSDEIPLPYVQRKEVSPKKSGKGPNKVTEDIPSIESMTALVEKGNTPSHSKSVLSKSSSPLSEGCSISDKEHLLQNSLSPEYYPPEVPGLDIATSLPSIKEEHLEYIKKKTAPSDVSLDELPLPYVAGKRIIPSKPLMTPKSAFESLPKADRVIGLATRKEQYPNTRDLIEAHPAPSRVTSELVISEGVITPLDTEMIQSQSKEILEDYNEENRLSAKLIALAKPELEGAPSESETRSLNQSNRFTQAFLSEIPPPSHLETVSYHNEFDADVHYAKKEDGKGYLFSIKMKPNEKLNFASPSQHFIFVIDGSSSIKKHRFGVFKEGVGRALSYLGEGDSFNIVVADAELTTFSKNPTPWDKRSAASAKRFLIDRDYRGFFINYDAFELLSNVSNYFAPDKENIVILITDGHSFKSFSDHKNDFKQLVSESKGKFSIFTATASHGNNLSMLDLLSTFNNGELMYSKTNASFSRQLAVLVKHIESFVAKDIHVNITSTSQETGIEFYPNEKTLPSLYSDRPYIVCGSIDELKDFDLMLQGRSGGQWINIKQKISFKHAQKATHSIKKGIALQKAYVCYDYFLKNDDPFFLTEAQSILEPLNIPTAIR